MQVSEVKPSDFNKVRNEDVSFQLFTRENILEPFQIDNMALNEINANKLTKFIIHGFFENSRKLWYDKLTKELLKKGDYNVVQVDWSKPASSNYRISASNAKEVGNIIGKLISNLLNNPGISLDNIHIIGHSLGAQVAGHAGREVLRQTGKSVARITALDAAGPLFEGPFKVFQGLNKKDAKIVDAIHTDGGAFGCKNPIGTVDFFPNGGRRPQPGCSSESFSFPPYNYHELLQNIFCSHTKSYHYFIDSINNEPYVGLRCESWTAFQQNNCNGNVSAVMGEDYVYSPTATGNFFLRIN